MTIYDPYNEAFISPPVTSSPPSSPYRNRFVAREAAHLHHVPHPDDMPCEDFTTPPADPNTDLCWDGRGWHNHVWNPVATAAGQTARPNSPPLSPPNHISTQVEERPVKPPMHSARPLVRRPSLIYRGFVETDPPLCTCCHLRLRGSTPEAAGYYVHSPIDRCCSVCCPDTPALELISPRHSLLRRCSSLSAHFESSDLSSVAEQKELTVCAAEPADPHHLEKTKIDA